MDTWPSTHVSPDDRYCFYCDKQYSSVATFGTHVRSKHGDGLAKSVGLLNEDGSVNAEYPVNTRVHQRREAKGSRGSTSTT